MQKFGIIGEHLSHTFSPLIYNDLFKKHGVDATYKILEIPRDAFDFIVKDITSDLAGYNVTIPYKSKIMGYLESVSQDAKEIGAVNVVNHLKKGFNTDWQGFRKSLENVKLKGKYALVLGAGGAARAICYALKKMDMDVYITNRTRKRGEKLAAEFDLRYGVPSLSKVALLVNATPIGMYPNVEEIPSIDLSRLSKKCVVYDLVYNPRPTKLIQEARNRGLRTIDGLEMLVQQAILNLRIWSLDELADDLEKNKNRIYELLKEVKRG